MEALEIFALQLVLSIIVYSLLAKWYVAPWLVNKPINSAITLLLIPHALRHLGLMFLVPGVNAHPLPTFFANAAAYGDLISGLLAIICMLALRGRWRIAFPLVWIFNIVGTVDLLNALRHADVVPSLGATWYIPTFVVPLLLVTHIMIFARLLRRRK